MYRILTERTNEADIRAILDKYFDAYTTYDANGRWKGKSEASMVVELDGADSDKVLAAAKEIKATNKQDAVMVQEIADSYQLV